MRDAAGWMISILCSSRDPRETFGSEMELSIYETVVLLGAQQLDDDNDDEEEGSRKGRAWMIELLLLNDACSRVPPFHKVVAIQPLFPGLLRDILFQLRRPSSPTFLPNYFDLT